MRLGIFGGSFDPVHYGHLIAAECCREQAQLDELWFVPAAVPPHKLDRQLSLAADREEMLRLAIGGQEAFRLCRLELERGGVSYTVDTLEAIHGSRPDDTLFLLLGGDSLRDLPTWREPKRICELATPLVVTRPGAPEPDYGALAQVVGSDRAQEVRRQQVAMPQIDLSSTDLRQRVRHGQSIRYRTPRAVEAYITAHRLYRPA
ncbi:MAG TPA: nicotinate-nucleotide adenylyltransferase [Pirellulales bacterium]|jgi:nicotinate-nucleotide adenylyltransferase|nr:nicotinate-nucleotide adenylyltransferase [Pirellulales bacterium]